MKRILGFLLLAILLSPSTGSPQTTLLLLDSQPGDWVGNGEAQRYSEVDGNFGASRNFDGGVSIYFNAPDYSHWWYLDFAAPGDAPMSVQVYETAASFPSQLPTQPGLRVFGDGRGCSSLTGRFEVLEVTYGPTGDVVSFAANFEQHCEGSIPALNGLLLFNSGVPVPPKVELTLTGCTSCHVGDQFVVEGRLRNLGTHSTQAEFKLGLRLPNGTPVSLFGPQGEHQVITLPAGADTTFPILNFPWPAGLPIGTWRVESSLLESTLGKQFSRDVKTFEGEP